MLVIGLTQDLPIEEVDSYRKQIEAFTNVEVLLLTGCSVIAWIPDPPVSYHLDFNKTNLQED